MNRHKWNVPPAGFTDRLFALSIDSFILGGVNALILSMLPALKPAISFLNIGYFIFFQIQHGATPGKMLLGLRVVGHADLEAPSNRSIFMRETLGRLASIFSLIGYFLPLFNKDKRALHDLIAGTRVIREREGESSVAKMFAIGGGVMVCLAATVVYVMLYTAVPLRYYAKNMELVANVKIDGVNGSIMKGLRIDSISFDNEEAKGQVRNLRFEYDLGLLFKEEWLTVSNIRIGGGKIELAARNPMARKKPESPKPPPAADESPTKTRAGRNFAGVLFKNIDITGLEVSYAQKSSVKLTRFYMKDVRLGKDRSIAWEQLHLESETLRARTGKVEFNATGDFKMSHSLEVVAKAGLTPEIVKDIDVKFFANRTQGKFTSLSVSAFGGRILGGLAQAQGYHLTLKGFTGNEYFKGSALVRNVSVTVTGRDLMDIRVDGQFQIGERVVPVASSAFRFNVGARSYSGLIKPVLWGMGILGGKLPVQMVQENATDLIDPREEIAQLAFGRSLTQLAPPDRRLVMENGEIMIMPKDTQKMLEMIKSRMPASN